MSKSLRFRNSLATAMLIVAALAGNAAAARASELAPALHLHYCNSQYQGYCGHIVRQLDPVGEVAGTIDIAFELYPHFDRSRPALGTILTEEGGPGYSSTGSRDGYVRLFAPLREQRDILIVDLRGTGNSGVIDCEPLRNLSISFRCATIVA